MRKVILFEQNVLEFAATKISSSVKIKTDYMKAEKVLKLSQEENHLY